MSQLLADLIKQQGINDARIVQAFARVQRYQFIATNLADDADLDMPLPIGYRQTISQPFVVARMMELLLTYFEPQRVLEIGTGSGYQAALLAEVVEQVYSVERIEALYLQALKLLSNLGYRNINLCHADGTQGWTEYAPFDAIIITAASEHIPADLVDQLSPNGRMVLPLGKPHASQQLCLIIKDKNGAITQHLYDWVVFVPLLPDKS